MGLKGGTMKDFVSIKDLSKDDILNLINLSLEMKKSKEDLSRLYKGRKVASLFFENSTRTRISSETAAINLGAYVNGFAGIEGTSVQKGEPLLDTIEMLQTYQYDAVVMRHNLEGSARFIADKMKIPVINGGDGGNSHPTQTMLDLLTIYEHFQTLDGLKIALVGDLKFGRTVHSMMHAMTFFKSDLILVSPESLKMGAWRIDDYKRESGRDILETDNLEKVLAEADVVYMTRIQRERFPQGIEGELEFKKVSGVFKLSAKKLDGCKNNMIVLHPLPRYKHDLEIDMSVDSCPQARYIEQAQNGLFMRQAILDSLWSGKLKGRENVSAKMDASLNMKPIINGVKAGEKLVYRLANGTLIDHLEAGKGLEVYRQLKLDQLKDQEVMLASNIRSKKWGRKDVIAIHGKSLEPKELYRLGLISQNHTINSIQESRVIAKGSVQLPSQIENMIVCSNPKCISRYEHHEFTGSLFHVESREPLALRCHYCEKPMTRSEIEIA